MLSGVLFVCFCTLYLHACQMRMTEGDLSLCCVCVTSIER